MITTHRVQLAALNSEEEAENCRTEWRKMLSTTTGLSHVKLLKVMPSLAYHD